MTTPKRFYLGHNEFRFMRMFLQHREIYFIAGTNSLFIPSRQEKYVQFDRPDGTRVCREWPNSKGEKELLTPGEAARSELARTFPGLRRVGWMAASIKLFDWRWPMLYQGPFAGRGAYIDLSGAYHQLYSRLWLDTAFPCGYGTLSLSGIADNLKEWKAARNSLVGVTAARQTMGVRGYKSFPLHTKNAYLSPGLWATIQAILNELAFFAEKCGARYIATDGYIFDDLLKAEHFEEVLYDSGLRYRKATGRIDVKGWGSYAVGKKATETYKRAITRESKGFRSINILDSEYPNRVLRWWSKSIPRYSQSRWQEPVKQQWLIN